MRQIAFHKAINEAIDQSLSSDPSVFLIGLGAADPKGIFGSTLGLNEKYGDHRVMEMPISENAVTGIAIGAAITGMRPILTHQRIDFALVSMEQIVNQAAKWHYMFGGQMNVPIVIRMIIGRGWGQGPQHSQSLQSWFAHVPGLKVVMPANSYDAKGLLISSIEDNNPIIFIEHRWLFNIKGEVPEVYYRVPLGTCDIKRVGNDVTIIANSYMTLEALRAADRLIEVGIDAEVVDLRTITPIDWDTILASVRKTGRVLIADTGSLSFGVSAEISAKICEEIFADLKVPPRRVALPDSPSPTSSKLLVAYYPRAVDIANSVLKLFDAKKALKIIEDEDQGHLDIPNPNFEGPF